MTAGHRPLKIGLLGLYRCGNLGDEAIWQAFAGALRAMLPPGSKTRMITYGPGGFESAWLPEDEQKTQALLHAMALDDPGARNVDVPFWAGSGFIRFLRMLSRLDAVWYAGGHWLHDLSLVTLAGIVTPLIWGKLRGINTGYVNIGAGPLDSEVGGQLVRMASTGRGPKVLRDQGSAEILKAAGVATPVDVTADSAWLLNPEQGEIVDQTFALSGLNTNQPVIGIVPCAWFKMAHLYDRDESAIENMIIRLAGMADSLTMQGNQIALIPTMLPEDEHAAKMIHKIAQSDLVKIVPTRKFSAKALMGMIARLRALVSFRMHPILFAYRTGVPFVALDYAPKLNALVHSIGMEKWLVPLEADWATSLEKRLSDLLHDSDPLAGGKSLEELQAKALEGLKIAVGTLL